MAVPQTGTVDALETKHVKGVQRRRLIVTVAVTYSGSEREGLPIRGDSGGVAQRQVQAAFSSRHLHINARICTEIKDLRGEDSVA